MSDIQRILVIGAGTMGHGIAGQAALVGYDVMLNDVAADRVQLGLAKVAAVYAKGVARGKVAQADAATARARLHAAADLDAAAATADLIIEAAPEDMALKKTLLKRLESAAPSHCLLATNTSSLSITEIAAATDCPDRVVGMHFFNPVAVMPLLELVRGEYTTEATLDAARAVGARMKKECIVVDDAPGFATSRLGIALGNEAMRMFEEGVASAEDIDKAMVLGYRHPIGPLALTDLVGLDVRLAISEHLFREIGSDSFRPPRVLRRMVRAGKLGRKTGQGFFRYD